MSFVGSIIALQLTTTKGREDPTTEGTKGLPTLVVRTDRHVSVVLVTVVALVLPLLRVVKREGRVFGKDGISSSCYEFYLRVRQEGVFSL